MSDYNELFKDINIDSDEDTLLSSTEGYINSSLCNVPTPLEPRSITACMTSDGKLDSMMILNGGRADKGLQLHCFCDKNKVNYRIYFSDCTRLDDPVFQNKLCKFLDSLSENQSIDIYLGNGLYGSSPVFSLGNMIDALHKCRGKVTTYVNGRAGFAETCLWLYGQERIISKYGTLCFSGVGNALKGGYMWTSFWNNVYSKAKDLGILTDSDVTDLLSSDIVINVPYADYMDKMAVLTNV